MRAMTINRMDIFLIVVADLEATKAFFIELGLKLEAQFDEERLGGFEVGDNDEEDVHPINCHSPHSLPSLLVTMPAARVLYLTACDPPRRRGRASKCADGA